MSCGAGCRCGSDPALLWLWCRPAATAPIGPLAGELPYAAGAALEKAKSRRKGGGGGQKKSENQGRKNMGKSVLGAWVCEFTRNASPDPWPATFGVSINLTLHSPAHLGGAALPCPAHVRPGSSRDGFAPEGDGAKSLSLR